MRIFFSIVSLFLCCASLAEVEFFLNKDHGFVAQFPAEVDEIKLENSLGPIFGYVSVDEDKLIIYQIQVHDVLVNREIRPIPKETAGKLVQTNFESYCKHSKAIDVKSRWSKVTAWPAIEFSCTHKGLMAEGVVSYKRGFAFMHEGKYYKITVHGFEKNDELKKEGLRFLASFSFADRKTIDKIDKTQTAKE